jgi:hypothetical protein
MSSTYVKSFMPIWSFKYGLRHSVEGWASILQAFGHSNVAIPTKGFDEACFVFVFFSWLDLMVATQTI